MSTPVVDLHCDLLDYLAHDTSRTPADPESNCSLPQLKEGGVKLQTLAVFTRTGPESVAIAERQFAAFERMTSAEGSGFRRYESSVDLSAEADEVFVLPSIENASGLCLENEPLDSFFKRFDSLLQSIGKPLYMSLTWANENRFAGGNGSDKGLCADGEEVIRYMDQQGIALDFSHMSDKTADDSILFITKHGLKLPVLASHSNYRVCRDHIRNLPPVVVEFLKARGGVIGFNFVHSFLSDSEEFGLATHLKYALELGLDEVITFGADFLSEKSLQPSDVTQQRVSLFHPHYNTAACFARVRSDLQELMTKAQLEALCFENAERFIQKVLRAP